MSLGKVIHALEKNKNGLRTYKTALCKWFAKGGFCFQTGVDQ
jgi:hypothetical protein